MRNYGIKLLALAFLLVYSQRAFSQLSGCNNAQNFCSNPGFSLTSAAGSGLPGGLNVSNPSTNPAGVNSGCLFTNGPGPNWMVLTVGSSGMLGFSFGASGSAFPQTGFYDWAMWPFDANTCNAIFANTLPPAACNWNGSSSGGTGMGIPPPGGSASNYQPSIPVTVGQQFIILLSNFSGVTTSVTISNNGSAGLACSPLVIPSATVCPSQPTVVTAAWAANVSNISYTLANSLSLGSTTVQSSPVFNIAPTTSQQVYNLYASGINPQSAVLTASTSFTVYISPTIPMGVLVPNPVPGGLAGNICYGTPATFTAQSPGTSFTLTGANGIPTIVSPIQVVSTPPLTNNGSYTISTTLFSGCTATGAVNVNVSPSTTISLTPPVNVCLFGAATLTANLPSATTYSWSGPNSFFAVGSSTTLNNVQLSAGGTYTVRAYLNYNGISCLRTATTQINVVATSEPTITASPSKTLCQGNTLNLTANITGNAGYLWQGPGGYNTSSQSTTVSAMMPHNAGIYTVTAIFSNGAISCPRTNTNEIKVVATSVPTINLMPSNICQHNRADLSVTSSTALTANSYLWVGPNNFTSTSATPSIDSIQPVASGMYYVWVFYSMGVRTCSVPTNGQINVVQVSTVSVIPPSAVCRPNNVPLIASAVQAIGYTWKGPNNYVDYQSNPVLFHPQTTASGIYTVTVAFGGGALVCYNTNTVNVTINPSLNFSLVPYQQVCYNKPIQINGPPGATSYSWTSSSGFTSNLRDVNLTNVEVPDEGTYTLSASLGPCVTTHTSYVKVIERIKEIYSQPSTTICKGDSITVKSEVVGGNGNKYAFIWNPSVYLNAPDVGVQKGIKPLGTTIYNVQAYDPICAEYKTSHTFTVTVLNAAKSNLQLKNNVGCEPFTALYDSKVGKGSLVTYDFVGNNGWTKRIQSDSINIQIPAAGIYTLKVKTATLHEASSKVCADSSTYAMPIIVNPKPGGDFSWYPEAPTISENDVTFIGTSRQKNIRSREWIFDGTYTNGSIEAVQQRLFQYTGKYPILLVTTTDEGCMDTVRKMIDIRDDFNVFIPNSFTPNNDNINDIFALKGTGIKTDGFTMQIFDRWGGLLFTSKDPAKGWDGMSKGQSVEEGVYVYHIRLTGSGSEGKKEYTGHVTLIR